MPKHNNTNETTNKQSQKDLMWFNSVLKVLNKHGVVSSRTHYLLMLVLQDESVHIASLAF